MSLKLNVGNVDIFYVMYLTIGGASSLWCYIIGIIISIIMYITFKTGRIVSHDHMIA